MNEISYDERVKVYEMAMDLNGREMQTVVAIEEMSELIKELCKQLRGLGCGAALAEEVADAAIMLEQVRMMYRIDDAVDACMDAKIRRLADQLKITGQRE